VIHLDGQLITDDMTLVTLLACHGYNGVMKSRDGNPRHVLWVIDEEQIDELAEELISDYRRGAAQVEPARFTRELRAVRSKLYEFLKVPTKPVGLRDRA
jgi:hypothetical protein